MYSFFFISTAHVQCNVEWLVASNNEEIISILRTSHIALSTSASVAKYTASVQKFLAMYDEFYFCVYNNFNLSHWHKSCCKVKSIQCFAVYFHSDERKKHNKLQNNRLVECIAKYSENFFFGGEEFRKHRPKKQKRNSNAEEIMIRSISNEIFVARAVY